MTTFSSGQNSADELFEKGVVLLKENNFLGALSCIEKAYSIRKRPEAGSYLGFCIAYERGQITEAIALCRSAIAEQPGNPVHYLNLARVYLKAKRKDDALDVLRKGISFGDNKEILSLLENVGVRKETLFPFLRRSNFLNKYAGLLLHRLKLR